MLGKRRTRANGEGSLYQRNSDKRWIGTATFPDGRTKTVSSMKRRDALERWEKLKEEARKGAPVDDEKMTVQQWLEYWHAHIATPRVRSSSTLASYDLNIRRMVPLIGHHRLKELAPDHIRRMHLALSGRGLSARSVQQCWDVLRAALNDAVEDDKIVRNPAKKATPAEPPQRERVTLSRDQVRTLFRAVKGDRLEALWIILLTTGLRSGEACGLKWSDIDWENGTFTLQRQMRHEAGKGRVFLPTKGHKMHALKLHPSTLEALRRHRAQQELSFRRLKKRNVDNLIFPNKNGDRLAPSNVYESFQRRLKWAGLDRMRVHDLRHTVATYLASQGWTPIYLQHMLTHSSSDITMQLYTHVLPPVYGEMIGELDAFFEDIEAETG